MKKNSQYETAQKYAKALFDAAQAKQCTEKVFQDVEMLRQSLNAEQIRLLSNPQFEGTLLDETLAEIKQKLNLSDTTLHFLKLLASRKQFYVIMQIFDIYTHIFYKAQGVMEVCVQSVRKLSAPQVQKLEKGLEKALQQRIHITYILNPNILGGLSLQYGDILVDDTIRGKLNQLEKIMKGHE